MKNRPNYIKEILSVLILSCFFLILGNGIINLTNTDEVFYAQTAREMIQHNTWTTPYLFGQPQFEKPIFTYWLLRIAVIIFGVSDFGMRFFPALFATAGVIAVYLSGVSVFKDGRKAFLASLILMSSGLYIGLARSVSTDMIFSVLVSLSLLSFFWGYNRRDKKAWGLLLFFAFAGLSVLAKGPLGLLITALVVAVFLLIRKDIKFVLCKYSLWGIFIFALISAPWYVFIINKYGHTFTHEFFYNDHIRRFLVAEHPAADNWYFYPLFTVIGMLPWSAFLVAALISLPKLLRREERPFYIFLTCWIGVTFFIFQIAHSKLISYTFPVFPALAFIIAGFVYDVLLVDKSRRPFLIVAFGTLCLLLIVPVSINVALVKYLTQISAKINITSKTPFYCLSAAFLALIAVISVFVLKKKALKTIYAIAATFLLFFCFVPFIKKDVDLYQSSQDSCEYLLKNYSVNNVVLCSKLFARGVRYYTDKEVAVIDVAGTPLFSPHPIPYLNTDQKAKDFLCRQPVTYCIVKRSGKEDLERITGREFKCTVLNKIGNAYILRVEKQS